MPLPEPEEDEDEDEFIGRCMSEIKREYPDRDQRLAICYRQWRQGSEDSMSRSWYEIRDAKNGAIEVLLYDEIGVFGISAADFVKDLRTLKASTIELRVNSPGGDVFDGIAIYNALKEHDATVNATVEGLAASSAAFITQAADRVYMATGATMMIHEPSGVTMGDAADHMKMAETLDKVGDNIAGIIAKRAGGTESEWRGRMRAESWYRAQEAVTIRLADAVLEDREARAYASIFNLSKFHHIPDWLPKNFTPQAVDMACPSHETAKAPEGELWTAPTLSDFTSSRWEDLSEAEKRHIAMHFVWSDSGVPPERFSDLSGGHHRPSMGNAVGPAVWRGVSSGRMAQGPWYEDAGVRRHLARHYEQFGRTPPWEEQDANTEQFHSGLTEALRKGVAAVVTKNVVPPHDYLAAVKAGTAREGA